MVGTNQPGKDGHYKLIEGRAEETIRLIDSIDTGGEDDDAQDDTIWTKLAICELEKEGGQCFLVAVLVYFYVLMYSLLSVRTKHNLSPKRGCGNGEVLGRGEGHLEQQLVKESRENVGGICLDKNHLEVLPGGVLQGDGQKVGSTLGQSNGKDRRLSLLGLSSTISKLYLIFGLLDP